MEHYTGTRIIFRSNSAERGGGITLEANAKIYILKYDLLFTNNVFLDTHTILFIANRADYGGAVYVDDDTNSGTCASDTKIECVFQVLAIHGTKRSDLETQSMHFSQNYANISGSTLYGGLLDRCAVSQFAEVHSKISYFKQNYEYKGNGESYFKDISSGKNTFISSLPIRVCVCISNEPNCTHQKVKKRINIHILSCCC